MKTYSEHLAHFGIRGMKWGVKNGPPYPLSSEQTAKMKKSVGNPKKMSDDELKERTRRLRAEKEYSDLAAGDIRNGKEYVAQYLAKAGSLALNAFAKLAFNGVAIYGAQQIVKRVTGGV